MNGRERITRILKHQPVDRIGIFEHFWNDTMADYAAKGKVAPGEDYSEHFGLDMSLAWVLDLMLDLDFTDEIIKEDEDTITRRNGNGAVLRTHKHHDTTPEHVDFAIKTRGDWDKVKHFITDCNDLKRRINFEAYRQAKTAAAKSGRFFALSGVNVFESMHPVCGHEHLLAGMALEPEWVAEMAEAYAELIIKLQTILFEREGLPDGIWYYEDMGFKERPFMSPAMYRELLYPSHKRTFGFARELGLPIIVHSCGFVEPLLPDMIDAGMDCLQVIEVKAGMDLLRIHARWGDKIALMGGIDVRKLYTNDKSVIDAELLSKIPIVKRGFGYVAHSDHSIPKTVDYEIFRYYIDKALELGRY
jgi:uroporphyrinogen decarboxylase